MTCINDPPVKIDEAGLAQVLKTADLQEH